MRIISVIFIAALAAVFCGCTPVVSVRPLYTDEDLKHPIVEPRIEGEWISPDLDKVGTDDEIMFRWKIAPNMASNAYHLEFRPGKPDPGKGDQVYRYDVRLIAMGDKFFFDADFDETVEGPVKAGSNDVPGLVGGHIVGRIWVHSDYLRLAFLNPEWMKDNAPDSFRELKGGGAIITASTQELRDFLLRNSDNEEAMFQLYLCRPGVDCAMRMFDDELSKLPENGEKRDELLDLMGKFLITRGDYDRALVLERLRLQSKPHDFRVHEDLGLALLFNKDFQAARIEFAAAQKLAGKESRSATEGGKRDDFERAATEAAENTVWSYFVEGDYSGAVGAFATYKAPIRFLSANPILLSYFSLRRLGKRTEAEALLKEQSGKFEGSAQDHLLLLDVQGRLVNPSFEGDALQRWYFYTALQRIEDGNVRDARWNLQYALEYSHAPKDGLPALAAKVELDRLGPLPKK